MRNETLNTPDSWKKFIRVRLAVTGSFLILIIILRLVMHAEMLLPLLVLGIVEFAESLVYRYMASSRIIHRVNYVPFVLDVLFVSLFLYLMGSIRTVFFIAYIWPIIIATRLTGRKNIPFLAGLSAFLFLILFLGQRFDFIPGWIVMNEKGAMMFLVAIGLPYLGFTSYMMWGEGVKIGGVEDDLKKSEEKFRMLVETSPNIIAILRRSTVSYINGAVQRLLGYKDGDLVPGKFDIREIIKREDKEMFSEKVRETLEGAEVPRYNLSLIRKDGTFIDMIINNKLISFQGEPAVEIVLVDVTSQRKMMDAVQRLSRVDYLTGLYNSRQFFISLESEKAGSAGTGKPFSMLSIDMDGFKKCNDRYGHEAGDRVLQRFGRMLNEEIRAGVDKAFRRGGDEFLVLLPGSDVKSAIALAEKLRVIVKEQIFPSSGVTIRIGTVQYIEGCDPAATADKAMYKAKELGGNNVYAGRNRLLNDGTDKGQTVAPVNNKEKIDMKILVVDDDADVAVILKEMLDKAGFDAETANSGREALRMIKNLPIDLILLDIRMPEMNGVETLGLIKDAGCEAPVIMMTAYDNIDLAEEAFRLGACDFIFKPMNFGELINEVLVNYKRQPGDKRVQPSEN